MQLTMAGYTPPNKMVKLGFGVFLSEMLTYIYVWFIYSISEYIYIYIVYGCVHIFYIYEKHK